MNRKKLLTEKIENMYFAAGLLLSCLCMIPFLLLGTGSIIAYHDQLDGELLGYLLTAKYLFTDIRIYPEIMNGLPAAGAVVPAPLFVLLYGLFKPFTAFLLTQWIIYLISFTGMYFLLMKLTQKKSISFGIAVVFMLLPFYPVYGLCIPGQPLLLFAILSLSSEECLSNRIHLDQKSFVCYLLIVLYGVLSSLVLVGFACLLALSFFALLQTVLGFYHKKRVLHSPWVALAVLLLTYLVVNPSLLQQVFSPKTAYISHRTEMVSYPLNFVDSLKGAFMAGVPYAQSYHGILLFLIGFCALIFIYIFFKHLASLDLRPLYRAGGILLVIFMLCLFYAFYSSTFVTELRNASGGVLKTFNLSRICWLLPTAWCIVGGVSARLFDGIM